MLALPASTTNSEPDGRLVPSFTARPNARQTLSAWVLWVRGRAIRRFREGIFLRLTEQERRILGRLARQGGIARARSLSASRRHRIAVKAARARWARSRAQRNVSDWGADIMNNPTTFTTGSLPFAAFLVASASLQLIDIELLDPRRASFVFDDPQNRGSALENQFLAGLAMVSASAYHSELRRLRRAIDERIYAARNSGGTGITSSSLHTTKGKHYNVNYSNLR